MNSNDIKSAIATISDSNISPYDLLLAIGNTDAVPSDIIDNRKTKILARDGKITSEGYIKNAIEDLSQISFRGKDQVLKVLKANIKSNLAGIEFPTKLTAHSIFIVAGLGIVILTILRKYY